MLLARLKNIALGLAEEGRYNLERVQMAQHRGLAPRRCLKQRN